MGIIGRDASSLEVDGLEILDVAKRGPDGSAQLPFGLSTSFLDLKWAAVVRARIATRCFAFVVFADVQAVSVFELKPGWAPGHLGDVPLRDKLLAIVERWEASR